MKKFKFLSMVFVQTLLCASAYAGHMSCFSADNESEIVLRGEFDPDFSAISNFELLRPDVIIFAIQNANETPTTTSTFKYRYRVKSDGEVNLKTAVWHDDAKRYLGPNITTMFSSYGENDPGHMRVGGIDLAGIWTQILIPEGEIGEPSFRAHLSFRVNFDDWASDKILLGVDLACSLNSETR